MKTSETYFRISWEDFFALYKGVKEIFREKAERFIIDSALERWPKGEGFGSSDRWHVVFGEFSSPMYDEETKLFSQPETVEDCEERVKRFLRDEMIANGMGEAMTDLFLEDPESVQAFFATAE